MHLCGRADGERQTDGQFTFAPLVSLESPVNPTPLTVWTVGENPHRKHLQNNKMLCECTFLKSLLSDLKHTCV